MTVPPVTLGNISPPLKAGRPVASLSADARRKAADEGQALPDGGYPIRNKQELAKAILALGRASNPAAAKRHIIKRARELGAVDMLPKAWGVTS